MIVRDEETAVVVDFHAHFGPAEPRLPDERGSLLLRRMDAAGVDFACVFPSATRGDSYQGEADRIVAAASEARGRIIPFARVHPFWREEAVSQLRAAASAGARGLKLHPFMDGAFAANDEALVHPLLQVAAELGLVVLVHSGWGWNSAPGLIADLARSFPSVNIVMGHAGRYGYHREAAAVGRDLPNLHYDVAGLSTPAAVDELVGSVGSDRVMFGSDHPYSPLGFEVEKTARWTQLPWDHIRKVVGGNAVRLLGIEGIARTTPRPIEPSHLGSSAFEGDGS